MLCGLQGNGKTTHAAKLAKHFIKQGRRPMLVACDIYRPAADRSAAGGGQAGGCPRLHPGRVPSPRRSPRRPCAHAKDYGNDIVILDTAGRLQIDEVLMQELVQIKEAVPVDETLLVVDAMAGQDAVNVAKTFNETVGVDGDHPHQDRRRYPRRRGAFRAGGHRASPSSSRASARSWMTSRSSTPPAWQAASLAWAMC